MSHELGLGIAVDIKAEQELGARIALLRQWQERLLGGGHIARIEQLERILHHGGGSGLGKACRHQGGSTDDRRYAAETGRAHGGAPMIVKSAPV